jgi:hypothetical protein
MSHWNGAFAKKSSCINLRTVVIRLGKYGNRKFCSKRTEMEPESEVYVQQHIKLTLSLTMEARCKKCGVVV